MEQEALVTIHRISPTASIVPSDRTTFFNTKRYRSFDIIQLMHNSTPDESLARELAESLDDMDSLPFYRHCTAIYTEEVLRQVQAKVLSFPRHKIRKTRGALFNSLLKVHGTNQRRPWA